MLLEDNTFAENPDCYFQTGETESDENGMIICPACRDYPACIKQRGDCGSKAPEDEIGATDVDFS